MKFNFKYHFYILFITLSCSISQTIVAVEAPWYEIEIIVFEQTTQTRLESEKWEQQAELPNTNKSRDFLTVAPENMALKQICLKGSMQNVIGIVPVKKVPLKEVLEADVSEMLVTENDYSENNLEQSSEQLTADDITKKNTEKLLDNPIEIVEEEKPFVILEHDLNQLNELKKTLSRNRNYRNLLHVSWRQPVERKRSSQAFRLFGGKNFSDKFTTKGDIRVNIATVNENFIDNPSNNSITTDAEIVLSQQKFSINNTTDDYQNTFAIKSSELPLFGENALITYGDYQQEVIAEINKCAQQFINIENNKHPDVWQLDGNINLYVERYLHVETDLFLRITGKEELQLGAIETSLAADRLIHSLEDESIINTTFNTNSIENNLGWQLDDDFLLEDPSSSIIMQEILNKYTMKQSRRLRRNEIHYIDHPLFGLLIQIRPYDPYKEPEEEI